MKCQEILNVLQLYKSQVTEVLGLEPTSVASAYSFIIIDAGSVHIQFEISEDSAKLHSIYPPQGEFKRKIESLSWPGLNSPIKHEFPAHVDTRLASADSIASLAVNCSVGDNYRPGNFSKIIYTTTHIELQQVNYMNAKSLDHKNNYSLRSLVFIVPYGEQTKMTFEFTDRSSENNRHCGDRIQAALDWMPDR